MKARNPIHSSRYWVCTFDFEEINQFEMIHRKHNYHYVSNLFYDACNVQNMFIEWKNTRSIGCLHFLIHIREKKKTTRLSYSLLHIFLLHGTFSYILLYKPINMISYKSKIPVTLLYQRLLFLAKNRLIWSLW